MTRKTLALLFLCLSLSAYSRAVTRTICASGCDHTTIAAAEAAAGASDILEFRGSETFDELWIPGGIRTIRVQPAMGLTVIFGNIGGGAKGAIDLDSAGASGVTVLGDPGIPSSLTLRTTGTNNDVVSHTGANNVQYHGDSYTTTQGGGGSASHVFQGSGTSSNYFLNAINLDGQSNTNSDGIQYSTASSSILVVHNAVFNNQTSDCINITGSQTGITAKIVNSTFGDCTGVALTADDPVSLINNVFSNDVTDDIALASPAVVSDFIFNNFEQEPIAGMPASNTDNVVTFVDAPGDNYCINNGSPAIDAGTTSDTTVDFHGVSRPQGPSYDQGINEVIPVAGPGAVKGSFSLLGVGI